MKKYHVATGDGKGYYGVGYESYREALEVLEISQGHDPQAHIVEEEYHFTNADRIRAMTDEELAKVPKQWSGYSCVFLDRECRETDTCEKCLLEWLKQPADK